MGSLDGWRNKMENDEFSEIEDGNYEGIDENYESKEDFEENDDFFNVERIEEITGEITEEVQEPVEEVIKISKERIKEYHKLKNDIEAGTYGYEGIANGGEMFNFKQQKEDNNPLTESLITNEEQEKFEEFLFFVDQEHLKMLSDTHILNGEQRSAFLEKIEDQSVKNLLAYCIDMEMRIAIQNEYLNYASSSEVTKENISRLYNSSYEMVGYTASQINADIKYKKFMDRLEKL